MVAIGLALSHCTKEEVTTLDFVLVSLRNTAAQGCVVVCSLLACGACSFSRHTCQLLLHVCMHWLYVLQKPGKLCNHDTLCSVHCRTLSLPTLTPGHSTPSHSR